MIFGPPQAKNFGGPARIMEKNKQGSACGRKIVEGEATIKRLLKSMKNHVIFHVFVTDISRN